MLRLPFGLSFFPGGMKEEAFYFAPPLQAAILGFAPPAVAAILGRRAALPLKMPQVPASSENWGRLSESISGSMGWERSPSAKSGAHLLAVRIGSTVLSGPLTRLFIRLAILSRPLPV